MLRAATLILLLAFLPSLPARAQEGGSPAEAARRFFQAVAGRDYARAWSRLTRVSQEFFIRQVARSERRNPSEVRALFDTNDPRLQRGFWDSFRESSRAPMIARGLFRTVQQQGDRASVSVQPPGVPAAQVPVVQMRREAGRWKVGWRETFFPSGSLPELKG